MTNQKEIKRLIAERERIFKQANEQIAWLNGRIYQLEQRQRPFRQLWQRLRGAKREQA